MAVETLKESIAEAIDGVSEGEALTAMAEVLRDWTNDIGTDFEHPLACDALDALADKMEALAQRL